MRTRGRTRFALLAVGGLVVLLAGGALVARGVTGPSGVTADPGRAPDHGGFYTSPVTITFSGLDAADTCEPAQVSYSGQEISSTCTSAADPTIAYSDTFGNTEFPYDDVAPTVHVPSGITVEAASMQGAVVAFNDQVTAEGGPDPTCSPKDSGDTFPIGTTTVNCSTTDAAGHSDSESFDVTVEDTTPPEFESAPDVTREGNVLGGYQGEAYEIPTATDLVDGGVTPECSPGPGAKFALGPPTVVTCTATDSAGNTATASFTVTVTDATPPSFLVHPQDVTVQAQNAQTGTPVTSACIENFLNAPTATDIVDGPTPVENDNTLDRFPLGDTVVEFTTADEQGNVKTESATVTVAVGPQGPCTIDAVPPGNVRRVSVRERNRLVVLRWTNPGASDFRRVQIQRSRTNGQGITRTFKTRREVFRDDEVRNRVQYRYVLYSVDEAGNKPNGVERLATPHRILLLRPRDGAVISTRRLTFDWLRKANASYYNFQLHRIVDGERRKVLSRWPRVSSIELSRTWRFEGRRHRLRAGRYIWFVWPGFGRLSAADYGALIGSSTFRFKRR